MPTFPEPSFRVPRCLNPLRVKHALLVAYWVYCYPTALKYYLYRANPPLYKAVSGGGLLKTLTVEAYRNLYFCLPLTIALVSIGLSAIALPFLPASPFSWSHWLLGLGIGNLIGLIYFIIFGITFSVTAGTARAVTSASTISVTAGVANAAVLAVVLGRAPDWSFTQLLVPGHFGIVVLFGLTTGVSVALTIGDLIGSIIGVATGLASGAIAGTVFGIIATAIDRVEVSSLVYAAIIGLATSGSFGASMTFASCLIICLVMGLFIGLSISVALFQNSIILEKAILYGGFATLIVWIGTLRLIPIHVGYLFYVALRAIFASSLKRHPVAWDELIILPLPGIQKYLEESLSVGKTIETQAIETQAIETQAIETQAIEEQTPSLQLVIRVARNPLHSPIVQRVLKQYLSQTENFLAALYSFLDRPASQEYVFAPVDINDWQQVPTNKQLLLAELSSQWLDCTSERTSYLVERFVFGITWLQRDHARTAETAFYQFLYDIGYGVEIRENAFNLANYAPVYSAFEQQPGGVEIKQSFDAIAAFLSYTHLSQLSGADRLTVGLIPASKAIRTDIVTILSRLSRVAKDLSTAESSNSLLIRQGSLLRANSTLEALSQQIGREVFSPESKLLQQIVEQWSVFVTRAGGEAGQLTHQPSLLKNPYIIGTPVTGSSLIGREDILRRIADELFATPGWCPSIVLYGHRRMGKSSILRSLSAYLPSPDIKVVDFNMQILGHVSNTGELIYALARQIYRSLESQQSAQVAVPERDDFMLRNPYHALDDFFQVLSGMLSGHSYIIAIDEFEKIEEKIQKGQISENLLEFLRGITQSYSWFSLIFAGLHTLEEMCYNYWHPFFTSIPIRVSFLPPAAAGQLIVQANNIAYDDEVISKIVQLTNGQPYLTQLIGHTLVTYFNRNLLTQKLSDNAFPVFNLRDLQSVLDSSEFYSIGNAYFKGIWLQALASPVEGQIEILKQLAIRPMSAQQLFQATGFTKTKVALGLNTLQEHDVIILKDTGFAYTVELMRMWVASNRVVKD